MHWLLIFARIVRFFFSKEKQRWQFKNNGFQSSEGTRDTFKRDQQALGAEKEREERYPAKINDLDVLKISGKVPAGKRSNQRTAPRIFSAENSTDIKLLKEENRILKTELCARDGSYSWCSKL